MKNIWTWYIMSFLIALFTGLLLLKNFTDLGVYWLSFWYVFFIALLICISVCLVGIEGALLFVPFFAVLFPLISGTSLTTVEAIRIGLFTEIFGFASAFLGFWRAQLIDFKVAYNTILVGVPAAILGGFLLYVIPEKTVLMIIGIWMLSMAFIMWRFPQEHHEIDLEKAKPRRIGQAFGSDNTRSLIDSRGIKYEYQSPRPFERSVVAFFGGIFTGMVGFGIGIVGLSHLVFRKIPIRVASGISIFVIMVVALTASLPHFIKVYQEGFMQTMPWNILILTVPAVIIGGQLAPRLAGRLSMNKTEKFLILLIIFISILIFYRAIVI